MTRSFLFASTLSLCALAGACQPALTADEPEGDDAALDADGKADGASSSKMPWAKKATLKYAFTRAAGFDRPAGPVQDTRGFRVAIDAGRVRVSGDAVLPMEHRYHRSDLAAIDARNGMVLPAVRLLALPQFGKALKPGATAVQLDPPTPNPARVTMQSRYTTRIEAVTGNVVAFSLVAAYKFPPTAATQRFAKQAFGEDAAQMRWMSQEFTDYASCKGEYDTKRQLLLSKRCAEVTLPARGTTVDAVLKDPTRVELAVELVGAQ